MGERDHSETCETCGFQRGGLNCLMCDCEVYDNAALTTLAHNLAAAAFGCAAFEMGRDAGPGSFVPFVTSWWRPGCGRPWAWPHVIRDDGCGRHAPQAELQRFDLKRREHWNFLIRHSRASGNPGQAM